MRFIFVNLKRFEVPRDKGGVCPSPDPLHWIETVFQTCARLGLGLNPDLALTFFLPEGLLSSSNAALRSLPAEQAANISIGCQGLHWEDIRPGKNFGAFTSSLPAAAAAGLNSRWAIIGHSEERRAKLAILQAYDPRIATDGACASSAAQSVNALIGKEVLCGLQAGLRVLLCVGETAQERGEGELEHVRARVEDVLRSQLLSPLSEALESGLIKNVVIGYEPVWAIGPGKIPPGKEYIGFAASTIKNIIKMAYGISPPVVYGGGLKAENAAMIGSIAAVDGGLVALTRFSGEIGFYPEELKVIADQYLSETQA